MSHTKTAIFLSIRDKAKRLPGKVMKPIEGRRAVEHLIDRLKLAKKPDLLIMTTSVHPGDDGLEQICRQEGIACFRGSEEDKLKRYLDAADQYGIEFCVVVDGDDLFCDAVHIDGIIEEYRSSGADYIIFDHLPLGVTGFGVKIDSLRRVVEMKDERDTEVWGGYFADNSLFTCRFLEPAPHLRHPEWRMTLDYPEDLAMFEAVFAALYRPGEVFSLEEIVDLLTRKPEISAINQAVAEIYAQGLRKAAPVRLKDEYAHLMKK